METHTHTHTRTNANAKQFDSADFDDCRDAWARLAAAGDADGRWGREWALAALAVAQRTELSLSAFADAMYADVQVWVGWLTDDDGRLVSGWLVWLNGLGHRSTTTRHALFPHTPSLSHAPPSHSPPPPITHSRTPRRSARPAASTPPTS